MAESLAALRNRHTEDLRRLAEEHFQHDLNQSDRDTLRAAAGKVSRHATIGSLVGLGLGAFLAFRLRNMRLAYFNAFRAMEKPVEVKFADGRMAPVPDITNMMQPSKWGDVATITFFSIAGLFLGGETGLMTGTASGARTISSDPQAKERIEKAFRNYRIDVMKKQIQELEGHDKDKSSTFSMWS
ncbi:hypothetical protein GQ43DRAFT_437630 [Delitschia confertaspora ATCC 74209]|uniref:Uncharacterized protein n=1 Tax=Delitschia confertaspora ATCC 74209 TaxID=1513339 RepID=A0A9P4JUT6_9PLEO|nr:hypothetical protein GQ43DRAFT_437630 [Delitschia confertaspora ATCC 74209]